jgi:hypothetical protein
MVCKELDILLSPNLFCDCFCDGFKGHGYTDDGFYLIWTAEFL